MALRSVTVRRGVVDGIDGVLAETDHSFPKHWHDQYGVGIMLHGAQISASGRGQVTAEAGDVITVNPGEVHDGAPVAGVRRWSMLYFDPCRVAGYAAELGVPRAATPEIEKPVFSDRATAAMVRGMLHALPQAQTASDRMAGEEAMLAAMAALLKAGERRVPDRASAAIRRALELIDDDPAAPLDLAGLAAVAGISRFQVLRGIARATGLTPHAYILQRRIELARRLIREGTGLAEVAAGCGFADQSHMTRLFTRTFGYPPGAYASN